MLRDWAGYWILAALVLFEFWDAQDWRSRYMACCAERSLLRSEQIQSQSPAQPGRTAAYNAQLLLTDKAE